MSRVFSPEDDRRAIARVCLVASLRTFAIPTWLLGLAVTAGSAEAMLAGVLGSR